MLQAAYKHEVLSRSMSPLKGSERAGNGLLEIIIVLDYRQQRPMSVMLSKCLIRVKGSK